MKRVIVIGTIHAESKNYPAAKLEGILRSVKPDVILEELTSGFYDSQWKRKKYYDDQEDKALSSYLAEMPTVVRPYDIEGRNQHYKETQADKKQADVFAAIERADTEGKLSEAHSRSYRFTIGLVEVFKQMFVEEHPRVINSFAMDRYVENMHKTVSETFTEILGCYDELRAHGENLREIEEYEDRRNQTMAKNILSRVTEFANADTFVVLCGLEHRFYLRKRLREEATSADFTLSEYWEQDNNA